MKKLKLELKKTTQQYGLACKEAALAKLKVMSCYKTLLDSTPLLL